MGIDAGRAPGRFGHLSGSAGRQTGSILAQLDGATTSPGGTLHYLFDPHYNSGKSIFCEYLEYKMYVR